MSGSPGIPVGKSPCNSQTSVGYVGCYRQLSFFGLRPALALWLPAVTSSCASSFRSPAHCVAGPSGPVLEHLGASSRLTRTRLRLRSTFAECLSHALSNSSHMLFGLSRDIVQGAAAQSNAAVAFSAATLRRGNHYAGIAFGYRGADTRPATRMTRMCRALLHGTKAMLARQIG